MTGIWCGALAITLAYLAAFLPPPYSGAAPWLMLGGTVLLLLALLLLGTRRPGRPRPRAVRLGFLLLGLVLLGSVAAALLLPPETAETPLLLGLPRRAALLVYGLGIVPVLFLPLLYALTFAATVLSEADLRALRARLADARRPAGPPC